MRFAFILYANQLGGHELMSSKLADQFVEANHEVTLFLPDEIENTQRLLNDYSKIKIQRYDSGIDKENKLSARGFVVSSVKRFRLIWRLKLDYGLVINCQGSFEQNWISSLFCRMLGISVASYVPYTSYPSERKARYSYFRDKVFGVLVRLPLKYIVIDGHYKRQLNARFKIKTSDILVFENKVHVEPARREVKVGDLNKPLSFVLPGRVYFAQKGQDLLIDAIKKFPDENLNLTFTFIGDGPDQKKLKEYISSNDLSTTCTMMPWRNDVNGIYDSCDCVILPSRYEGVSLVMLEAMAFKKPLLASNLDINTRFIKRDFLFESENVEDLSRKLLHIYDLLKKDLWTFADNYSDRSRWKDSRANTNQDINNWISKAIDVL